MASLAKENLSSELHELDWSFSGENGSEGLFGVHWYPARYLAQVPGILIGYLSEQGERVLDPFCGSGTTLLEAKRQGRITLGVDTNPVATLMSSAKLRVFTQQQWADFLNDARRYRQATLSEIGWQATRVPIPNEDENRLWYHPQTLVELGLVWQFLRESSSPLVVAGDAVFSSILRSVCSQDKHWGWICDNVRPKTLRYRSAATLFIQRLLDFSTHSSTFWADATPRQVHSDDQHADVKLGKCQDVLADVPDSSVHAVITSPPYFCMTDYARSQRLSFLWFDWDLDSFRSLESGARYKRHRKDPAKEYFDDMSRSFVEIARVLIERRRCAIVIGEAPTREPVVERLISILERCSLRLEFRLKRTLPRQRAMSSKAFEEDILIVRKS